MNYCENKMHTLNNINECLHELTFRAEGGQRKTQWTHHETTVNSIFDICPIEVGRTTPQCGIGDTTNAKILSAMHIRDTANAIFFAFQQKFRLLPVFISPRVLYHNMPSILFCKPTHCSPPSQHLALE